MSISDNLKHARLAKGLTQDEVGNLIGVAKQTIQKYEKGIVTNIPVERIEELAKIYEVSPAYLMNWHKTQRYNNEELKLELFGSIDDVTDKMLNEVKQYAIMVKDRENKK